MTSTSEEKRKEIIQSLDKANHPRAVPVLIEVLRVSSIDETRIAAIIALGKLADSSAIPILEQIFDNKKLLNSSNSFDVQECAKQAIEDINKGVRKPRDTDVDDFIQNNAI